MPGFIERHGVRTAFEVIGTGPALIMMHGAEGSRRQFAGIRLMLSDRYTVITYDQRDCGETVNPESPAGLCDLADDAAALLHAIGHTRAHVYGTSFGGRVAQAFALRHAEYIDRLILSSTWPLPVRIAEANAAVAGDMARLRQGLPGTAEQLAEYFFPADFLATHPTSRQHFRMAQPRSARTERRAQAVGDTPDLDITRITHPTLLIAGLEDRVVPAALTLSLSTALPDTRTATLPGVGHLSLAQVPQDIDRLIRDFLG